MSRDVPVESAPPIRARDPQEFQFRIDLSLADIDDLELFDADRKTTNSEMIAFLDRVVIETSRDGQSLGRGISGKGVPLPTIYRLMRQINDGMKDLQNAGN